MSHPLLPSVFISNLDDLQAQQNGGVQLCSQEFLRVIKLIDPDVHVIEIQISKSPKDRIARRFGLRAYASYNPGIEHTAFAELKKIQPKVIYVNKSEALRIAIAAKKMIPSSQVVLLSHGNQSGDDLFEVSSHEGSSSRGLKRVFATWKLGLNIVTESSRRREGILDAVVTMSPQEEVLENWLGMNRVFYFPRIVAKSPVAWAPVARRVGFIGTLNHPPNLTAIKQLLASGLSDECEFRIIGGPSSVGYELKNSFPKVQYCGRLSDAEANEEMATWSLNINPVFWLSRGASMKFGDALGKGVPVLTTAFGRRGYRTLENLFFECDNDPSDFKKEVIRLIENPELLAEKHARFLSENPIAPTASDVADELKAFLT